MNKRTDNSSALSELAPCGSIDLGAETWSTPLLLPEMAQIVAVARDGGLSSFAPDGTRTWRYDACAEISASPTRVGVEGRFLVLIGSHDGWLHAVSATTGQHVWRRHLGGTVRATVAVDDSNAGTRVFAASYGDFLWCLRGSDGGVIWKRWLPRHIWARSLGVVSSPLVADVDGDGRLEVVIGTRSWRLFCLDAESGALRWFRGFRYGVDSTASLIGDATHPQIVVGTGESLNGLGDNSIVTLDGRTGIEQWRYRAHGGVDGSATVVTRANGARQVVQVSLADASCYGIDAITGSLRWRFRMGPTDECCHDEDNICRRVGADYLTEHACCRSYTNPLVADINGDGRLEVLVGSNNGFLYLLDSETGEERGRVQTGGAVRGSVVMGPVGDNPMIVVPSGHRLLLYRTTGAATNWPMFKGSPALTGVVGEAPTDRSRTDTPGTFRSLLQESRLLLRWTLFDLGAAPSERS